MTTKKVKMYTKRIQKEVYGMCPALSCTRTQTAQDVLSHL